MSETREPHSVGGETELSVIASCLSCWSLYRRRRRTQEYCSPRCEWVRVTWIRDMRWLGCATQSGIYVGTKRGAC